MNVRLDVHVVNTLNEVIRRVAWRQRLDVVKMSAWYLGCSSSSSRTVPSPNAAWRPSLAWPLASSMPTSIAAFRKGLVKATQAPARRYAYYLTPQGFAEKSRLSLEYLTYSFTFFRQAKSDCLVAFETARGRGISRIALAGVSDLAEIATICARESAVEIVAIVDGQSNLTRFVGLPIARGYDEVAGSFDGVIVTDLKTTPATIEAATARFGTDRVLVPALLQKASKNAETRP